MSYSRVPDRIKAARIAANRAMQNAGALVQAVTEDRKFKTGAYDIPDLNDTLADLVAAMDAIKGARTLIEQANPMRVTTLVVGDRGPVETPIARRDSMFDSKAK